MQRLVLVLSCLLLVGCGGGGSSTPRGPVPVAPVITTQPASHAITVGDPSLLLTVAATGTPTPTFQWYTGGAEIAGQTASSYTTPIFATPGTFLYYVKVSNSAGTVTSNTATITVNPVQVVTPPDPQGIYTGTVNSNTVGPLLAYAACSSTGEIRYVANNGYLADIQLSSLSGKFYTGVRETNLIYVSNLVVVQGVSASGQYNLEVGDTGSFTFNYTDIYTKPVPFASLVGSYTTNGAYSTSQEPDSFTLDALGNIAGSEVGLGTYTGTLVQLDPAKNLYSVTLTVAPSGSVYTGLAFWSDGSSGLVANALYVQVSCPTNSQALGAIFPKN